MQIILKIIMYGLLIPLIAFFSLGVILYIGSNMPYFFASLIIDLILILIYVKLKKRVNNIHENEKQLDANNEQILNQDVWTKNSYEKINDSLLIDEKAKNIIINGINFQFSEILSAELIEDGIEQEIISGLGSRHKNFGTINGIGINNKLITKLDIEIKTTRLSNPFINITFLKLGIRTGFDKNSKKYKEAYNEAQRCLSTLQLIIAQNNNE